jgi:glycosyltransferase involved in cell wall biosynthesis
LAPDDHSPPLARRVADAFPEVTVVASTGRPGLSGARNTGLARATGDVGAFLDDDARAAPDWQERLAGGYASPEVVGAGAGLAPWRRGQGAWVRTAATVLLGLGFTAGGYLHGRVVQAAGDGQGRSSAGALPSASAPGPGSTRARSRSSSSRSRSSSSSR